MWGRGAISVMGWVWVFEYVEYVEYVELFASLCRFGGVNGKRRGIRCCIG